MKVLQINSVCGIGSTGRIVTDIHNILIRQGHKSYIAYGRDLPKNCDTSLKIGTKFDNYVHVALTRIFDKHGFGSKRATKEFIKKVKNIDPDVIHLHNIHGYYINIKILFNYLKEAKKPVIWTLHDCWAFTGHCSHFDYIGCDKWKTGCYSCPQKGEYPKSVLLDNSKKNYKSKKDIFSDIENITIITPSEWLAGIVKESFFKDYPVKVINNGIDLEVFKPTESDFRKKYNIENKFLIMGVASVWGERKGLYHFIELSKKLGSDELIVLVGLTEKQREQLPQNIIGINKTNNVKQLAEMYTAADVFINLTLEDNFPTVNIEALACGTQVITYDTGGSVESVDSSCGFIVEKNNINRLYTKILEFKNKQISNKSALTKSTNYERHKCYMEYIFCYNILT